MSSRDVSRNAITMIPANAFTNLMQLQTLFVLSELVAQCHDADEESIARTSYVLQVLV
jgi:hypothetical protein